jgi:tetratricopeptide (TPR) repeat protein
VLYLKWNQEAQKLFPQETWPRVGEGQAWFRMGRHDRARRVLEELLAEHPESWEARACLARVYWALGEHDRARQELTTLTSERSQEPAVILEVTSQLAAAGMWKEADEMLKRLSDADPGMKGEVLALKAKAALHFGRPAAAVPLLERALQIKPGDARLALLLAEAQSRAGDDLKALETLQSVAAGDTQDTELEYAAGCALFNLNRFAEASRWFERCGRVNFRPRSLPLLRARCSIKQGEYQQAIRVIQEARELNKESAEPAFYQGVALYLAGSAKQALPHFVRAYNLARKANNEALAHRARVNSCACYYQMGNQHVRDGKYVLAAQAYDVLRKNLKPAHPHFELITQTLLTCYVQAGLEVLVGNEEDGKTEAIPLFEKAASLGAGARVRMTLAGLYSAVTRYDDAVTLYDAMLREAPGNESLRFARALASSRTRTGKAGTAELERVFAQGGRYAVRAALALASAAAETKHFERAVETLLTAARLPGAKKNKYYGELCCKAVLYSVRAGNVPRARELAAELLERSKGYADVLVGSLIADDGDFVTALPYLDAGVPQDGKRTSETLLLEQVYRRAAYQLCEKKQFESAAETLERAIDRGQNGPVHQFARLAQAASKNAATSERIDEPVLRLLDELYRQGDRSEAMLVRSVAVAYHRRAYELATAGQHAESRRYWSRAHQLWIQEIRGKGQFWTDFISTYNRGQQYKLESNAPELEEHMLRQMGGLCVSFCGAMLEGRRGEPQKRRAVDADDWDGESTYGVEGGAAGRSGRFGDCDPNFDDAEFYFKEAKQLAGQAKAVEMFKEIVDVNAIIRVLDAGRNPSRAYHLFKFLYDKIDRSDEYKKAVGNAALGVAVDALQSDNVSLFMEWLDKAADHDSDMRTIRLVVRQLGQPMITRVLSRMSELGVRAVLRAKQPQMAGQFLLAAVVAVAQVNAQLRSQNSALSFETLFALLPDQARAILDEILAQVIKNLSGAS